MNLQSRRSFLGRGLCACSLTMLSTSAWSKVLSTKLQPSVAPDYEPVAHDERGLWQSCDEFEQQLATSNLLIKSPELTRYLTDVVLSLTEGATTKVRVYPVWQPDFNAGMFPNGVMVVNSGLLARVRNEAQLAAVLGHECGHFLRQHGLKNYRSQRSKSAWHAFVKAWTNVALGTAGPMGSTWAGVAGAINQPLLLSMFLYSQELESEADAYGLQLLSRCGYPPEAAAQVWTQLAEELEASAYARDRRYKESRSAYSSHPPMSARMHDLNQTAEHVLRASAGRCHDDRREPFLDVTRHLRSQLIEGQVKLNDPGASLYVINNLARDGWSGLLRYYEGEVYRLRNEEGDAKRAASAFAASVAFPDAPPQAHRQHGAALLKAGDPAGGKQHLRRYLELAPDATDAAMVRADLGE